MAIRPEGKGVPGVPSPLRYPVAADNKVYVASAEGVVSVLDAGEELKILATNNPGGEIPAAPAIVEGSMYVRTESRLSALGN